MKVFFSERQRAHYPENFLVSGAKKPNPEVPERIDRLLSGVGDGGHELREAEDHGLEPVAAVHSPEYLQFLEHGFARWQRIEGASQEIVPNIHPNRRDFSYPKSVVGQAGYHLADTACPISADTWDSARWSANTAVSAAEAVLAGDSAAYALCRPPGHHAFADLAGGFCYLNNSGIAAQRLRSRHDRVAILDVDLHHGNGTQGMFYDRADVLTVSIHADPVRFYPFFWGYASERGEGAGLGYNLNLPIPRGTADKDYMPVLERALTRVRSYRPTALVVALGLDASEDDPFGGLAISTSGFEAIGGAIGSLGLPTVLVQEGGYVSETLGRNLTAALSGFTGAHAKGTG